MIEILCFGDSNTYGFTPDWKHRYGRDIRYPGVLQALLGDGYYVAEDGLIGRTAAFPDSNRDGRSALETLPLSIESHGPVQYIILMLGTNDCKIDKTRSAEDVGAGMDKLVRLVIGMLPAWTKILLVAPPPLGPAAPQRDPEYDAQSLTVSQGVAEQYRPHRQGVSYQKTARMSRTFFRFCEKNLRSGFAPCADRFFSSAALTPHSRCG